MFRPCIDVKFGKVVQLEQGERLALTDQRTPLELAYLYEQDGLFGGHIIDLEGGKNKEYILPALTTGHLQVGGGIRLENGREFLDAGATHLIFSSVVFKQEGVDWVMLEKLRKTFSRDKIVLAPDVKSDRCIYAGGWKYNSGIKLDVETFKKLSDYCGEFLVHSIEVEGMEGGIDWDLVRFLSAVRSGPVTYAGGANRLGLIEELHLMGLDLTIGKAYFSGAIRHDDLVAQNQRLRKLDTQGQSQKK